MKGIEPAIVAPTAAPRLDVLGVGHTVRVPGVLTGGRVTFIEIDLPPASGIPEHVHSREDEIFHVLDGVVEFVLAGHVTRAVPGTTVFAPRDVAHGFKAAGPAVAACS